MKLKQLEVMEQQEPEYSRMASKVTVGSKIKWIVIESNAKLEISTEISTYNQ